MRYLRNLSVLAVLGLFVASGCADLDVTNPNAADRERALATPGDVESLVAGTFHTWWTVTHNAFAPGPLMFVSAASFQHSCWPANAGCVEYSSFPRGELVNSTSDQFYANMANIWDETYSALSAVSKGLRAAEDDPSVAEAIDVTRLRAYGKFVQGVGHASIALQYDQGFVVDETVDTDDPNAEPELLPSDELMNRALGFLDEAITLAEGGDFTIPEAWMSRPVEAPTLAALSHSLKARYMATVARTPSERESVDWGAVVTELDAGLQEDFDIQLQGLYDYSIFTTDVMGYWSFAAWQQTPYFIAGMADTSGSYQAWLDVPVGSRMPNVDGEPVLIRTPDTRFPQGSTLQDQIDSPGEYFAVPDSDSPCASSAFALEGNSWNQQARGTWRWSYYFDIGLPGCAYGDFGAANAGDFGWAMISTAELDLLRAEAHLRMGQEGEAAGLVDQYRTAHGLDAASSDDDLDGNPNDDCVPRLPDGTCGDLEEMLKWEKRLETRYHGPHANGWFFDGRGWGDLYAGTFLEFPVPEEDLLVLGMTPYTTGTPGAETSVYEWPGES